MLTQLSQSELEQIPIVRDYWINLALHSGKAVTRDEISDNVAHIYTKIGLPKPLIVICDSFLMQKLAVVLLIGKNVKSKAKVQVWGQIKEQVTDQVRDQLTGQVEEQVRAQVWEQVESQVRSQLWGQIRDQVESQLWGQVMSQVWTQVESQVRDQVASQLRDQVWGQVWEQGSGLGYDSGWLSFYDFFTKIGLIDDKNFNWFSSFYKKGVWDIWYCKHFVVICRTPIKVLKDERGRLHSSTEAAIQWRDGLNNYFISGVSFTKDLFERLVKKDLAAIEAISLQNVLQRTIACSILGYDRIMNELHAKEASYRKIRGLKYRLLEVNLQDDGINCAKLLQVECPSTGRETVLRVHPSIKDCEAAVAWTFGLEPKDYNPAIET